MLFPTVVASAVPDGTNPFTPAVSASAGFHTSGAGVERNVTGAYCAACAAVNCSGGSEIVSRPAMLAADPPGPCVLNSAYVDVGRLLSPLNSIHPSGFTWSTVVFSIMNVENCPYGRPKYNCVMPGACDVRFALFKM